MSEAAWNWHAGDIIFRSGLDPFDDRIAAATGARFGSAAILRASSGGPRVVYVDPSDGVIEAALDKFVSGLGAQDYVVYRLAHAADWGQADSPLSYNALLVAYGHPADPFRLPGGTEYYSAELVFLAALGAGATLGKPTRLAALAADAPALKAVFLDHWQDHPYCRYIVTRDECWTIIDDIAILTTASIMAAPELRRVYP
ncbi:C40 family peptidase [Pseudodonghicola xiamenensis]|uniref:Uncharacterized protein n=1 Tax=Pseudodonghicola xiamenensis TaxID=337702 RepID=A0A8J3H267_9RHOB|nr:hypothetical protein [Pseudodonghicola xiamenensis]GHG78889.1 hypothetical protein GCM10010961_00280 [Pseudodonghicola xiamenensis]